MNLKNNVVHNLIKSSNIDALLIDNLANIFWLTNIKSSAGMVLVAKKKNYLLIDGRYKNAVTSMQNKINIDKIIIVKNYRDDFLNYLNEIIIDENIEKLAMEDTVSVKDFDFFQKKLDLKCNLNFISTSKIRINKNVDEVANIKKGCDILAAGIKYIQEWIKIGVTEKETAHELERFFFSNGADALSFETIVAFGKNSALPHHNPTITKLNKNDIVLIDCGVVINGYCSDQTRTFFINEPNPKLKEIFEIVLHAQKLAISNIKIGMPIKNLDKIARDYITSKGYGNNFSHNLGHGLGIDVHEEPFLSASNSNELFANSVITIEPGIYVENLGGVRIEDDVYVSEKGIQNLNICPKEMQILKK